MTDDLLVKYMLGECRADEQEQVLRWLEEEPGNRRYFQQLRQIWETSRQLAASLDTDVEAAWQRFRQRTAAVPAAAKPVSYLGARSWYRIAAAVLLLMGLGAALYWLIPAGGQQVVAVTSNNQVVSDTLSDGSLVTLNQHSELRYPEQFRGNKRSVALKGEAFFNVQPNKEKPFIIEVNEVKIKVLGTSFNVKGRDGHTEVIVETGIVEVNTGTAIVRLTPGEKLDVTPDGRIGQKSAVKDHLYNYYRSREFVCDNTPLWKLAEVLEEAYGVKIEFASENLRTLPLTATFNNESLEQVLSIVSQTFSIQVERDGDKIILR